MLRFSVLKPGFGPFFDDGTGIAGFEFELPISNCPFCGEKLQKELKIHTGGQ